MPEQIKAACGPRILTFFLYLSNVEEGGETGFPLLDLKVGFLASSGGNAAIDTFSPLVLCIGEAGTWPGASMAVGEAIRFFEDGCHDSPRSSSSDQGP